MSRTIRSVAAAMAVLLVPALGSGQQVVPNRPYPSGTQIAPATGQSPGQVIPSQVVPGQVVPGQVVPGQVVPGQVVPGQVVPGRGVVPGEVTSGSLADGSDDIEGFPTRGLSEASFGESGSSVPVPEVLTSLLKRGGVPKSLDEFRELEEQQRRVSRQAALCTVSVQIGPAQGCGVIITGDGYVLSAAHVALRPNKAARLTMSDGRIIRATTLGMNRGVDAGLLKIDPNQNGGRPWPHATLGLSETLKPGMWCIAAGHPGGYDFGRGPVTRVGRILDVRPHKIGTDCALIGGDSGGPLFNIAGELIAIHSRIGNDVDDNLHVPIKEFDLAWKRMSRGTAWGYLPGFRPVLGVRGGRKPGGAVVEVVTPGSPAADAGIRKGDVIEKFGDVVITDFESLKAAVEDTMPGERLPIWINRGGERIRKPIEVGRADDD